jgi:hypothetical protein
VWLAIQWVAFRCDVGSIVGVVEDVKYFSEAFNPEVAINLKLPLDADVHSMQRLADQAVPRCDRAIAS